jgi:peptidoglycan hydrolase-like protein with peptidoglycan-binding domain
MNWRNRSAALALALVLPQSAWAECPGPGCPLGRSMLGVSSGAAMMFNKSGTIQRQKSTTAKRSLPKTRKAVNPAAMTARNEAAQVQAALNQLGFPAGTVDGVIGRKSRAAIMAYQESIGEAPTGTLTDEGQAALLARVERPEQPAAAAAPMPATQTLPALAPKAPAFR